LTYLGKVDKNTIYKKYFENMDYRFLGNDKETFIINKADNMPVAHCEIPVTASRLGTKFYYRKSNLNIVEFELRPFMNTVGDPVGN
jgi:hypothetical protein